MYSLLGLLNIKFLPPNYINTHQLVGMNYFKSEGLVQVIICVKLAVNI